MAKSATDLVEKEFSKRSSKIVISVIKDICETIDQLMVENDIARRFLHGSKSEKFMDHFKTTPQDFSIIEVTSGKVEDFEQILRNENVEYMASSNISGGANAEFVINRADLERILNKYPEIINESPQWQNTNSQESIIDNEDRDNNTNDAEKFDIFNGQETYNMAGFFGEPTNTKDDLNLENPYNPFKEHNEKGWIVDQNTLVFTNNLTGEKFTAERTEDGDLTVGDISDSDISVFDCEKILNAYKVSKNVEERINNELEKEATITDEKESPEENISSTEGYENDTPVLSDEDLTSESDNEKGLEEASPDMGPDSQTNEDQDDLENGSPESNEGFNPEATDESEQPLGTESPENNENVSEQDNTIDEGAVGEENESSTNSDPELPAANDDHTEESQTNINSEEQDLAAEPEHALNPESDNSFDTVNSNEQPAISDNTAEEPQTSSNNDDHNDAVKSYEATEIEQSSPLNDLISDVQSSMNENSEQPVAGNGFEESKPEENNNQRFGIEDNTEQSTYESTVQQDTAPVEKTPEYFSSGHDNSIAHNNSIPDNGHYSSSTTYADVSDSVQYQTTENHRSRENEDNTSKTSQEKFDEVLAKEKPHSALADGITASAAIASAASGTFNNPGGEPPSNNPNGSSNPPGGEPPFINPDNKGHLTLKKAPESNITIEETQVATSANPKDKEVLAKAVYDATIKGLKENDEGVRSSKRDRETVGMIYGTADGILSKASTNRYMLNELNANLSPESKNLLWDAFAKDDRAQERLLKAFNGDKDAAMLHYAFEIQQQSGMAKKTGFGTLVAQAKISDSDRINLKKTVFNKDRIPKTIGLGKNQISLDTVKYVDNRTAAEIQKQWLDHKFDNLFGKGYAAKNSNLLRRLRKELGNKKNTDILSKATVSNAAIKRYGTAFSIVKNVNRTAQQWSDDKTSQYMQKTAGFTRNTGKAAHIYTTIRKRLLVQKKEKLLREIARLKDRSYVKDIQKEARKMLKKGSSREEVDKFLKKHSEYQKKIEKKLEKVSKKADKPSIKEKASKLKHKAKNRIKKRIKNSRLGRSRLGRKIFDVRRRLLNTSAIARKKFMDSFLAKLIAKVANPIAKLKAFLAKLLMKLAIIILKIVLVIVVVCFIAAIAFTIAVVPMVWISEMFEWEGAEEFNNDCLESTLGIVYSELKTEEEKIFKDALDSFNGNNYPYIDELQYTIFDGTKTTLVGPAEYAQQELATTYDPHGYVESGIPNPFDGHDSVWATITGPEPFEGAPDEAKKKIRIVDGGAELLFLGAGGNPAHLSNVKEIVCMASLVQYESDLVYHDAPDKGVLDNDDFGSKIKATFTNALNWISATIETVKHAVSTFCTRIGAWFDDATGQDWYKNAVARKNARLYMTYAEPLLVQSHQVRYGLNMVFLPTAHTTDVEAPIANGSLSTILTACNGNESQKEHGSDEHEGHGCMSWNGFKFDDPTSETPYYNGEQVPHVYPAALISSDPLFEKDIPVAPGNQPIKFARRYSYGNNKDCWDLTIGTSKNYYDESDKPLAKSWARKLGIGDVVELKSTDNGASYVATVISNVSHDVINDTYDYTLTEKTFTYKGDLTSGHKGYYCGGHLILENYFTVFSFTQAEIESQADKYDDKNATRENEEDKGILPDYIVAPAINFFAGIPFDPATRIAVEVAETLKNKVAEAVITAIQKDKIDNAEDLFDIDAALYHVEGSVHKDFDGWSHGSIENAVVKYLEDWEKTYGIVTTYTIAGIDPSMMYGIDSSDGSGNVVVGTKMTAAEIDAVIAKLEENPDYTNDPSWPQRKEVVRKALSYVGQLHYRLDSVAHDAVLRPGATIECSGFASACWEPYISGTRPTTRDYISLGRRTNTLSAFYSDKTEGLHQAQPGDVLIRTKGGNHAVLYVGKIDGMTMSVDIGSEKAGCRYTHYDYYAGCKVIDMGMVLRTTAHF